jgi:hypothetical protein
MVFRQKSNGSDIVTASSGILFAINHYNKHFANITFANFK